MKKIQLIQECEIKLQSVKLKGVKNLILDPRHHFQKRFFLLRISFYKY
jgi:hypothetical protein